MKLVHKDFVKEIIFDENKINVLVVENKTYFSFLIQDFYEQMNGGEGRFILSENNKVLNMSRCVYVISDIFGLDLNQRKIINFLYSEIEGISNDGEMFEKTGEIKGAVVNYVDDLTGKCDYDLKCNDDIKITDLLKISDVKFNNDYDSIEEKLIDFMNVSSNVLGIKCFVIVNLKTFLDDKRLENLYDYVIYNKINLLLMENQITNKLDKEEILIIDDDLCELY